MHALLLWVSFPSCFLSLGSPIQYLCNRQEKSLWKAYKNNQIPIFLFTDHKLFGASKYYVCADRVPIVETQNAVEAFLCMVQACFVFDLDYPKLPLTMEFLERFAQKISAVVSLLLSVPETGNKDIS